MKRQHKIIIFSMTAASALAALLAMGGRIPLPLLRDMSLFRIEALLPAALIMMLRITDMTLVVFRTVFVVSGRTWQAAAVAAAEGSIWLAAAGIVFSDPDPTKAVGYALGVGLGTAIGMQLVRTLRLGLVTIRLFGPPPAGERAAELLRSMGHGATVFPGRGAKGPVEMVLSIMRRKEARAAMEALKAIDGLLVTVDSAPGPGHSIAGQQGASL